MLESRRQVSSRQGERERTLTLRFVSHEKHLSFYTFTLADHKLFATCLRASSEVMRMRNTGWKPPVTYPGYAPALRLARQSSRSSGISDSKRCL